MSAGGRTCEGCGQDVPHSDFSCPGCGKFYAGSFESPPPLAPTGMVRAVLDPGLQPGATGPPGPGMARMPSGKRPASGLRILAIVAAVVFGLFGVGCAGLAGLVMLGQNAETRYTQVGGEIGDPGQVGDPGTGPPASALRRPVVAAKVACDASDRAAASVDGNSLFDSIEPRGRGQYAQVMQMEAHATPAWLASVDLESGTIEAVDAGDWNDDMEGNSTVVVCASVMLPVAEESVGCDYAEAMAGRGSEPVTQRWTPTMRTIQVFALETGELLGTGEVRSAPAVCPGEAAPVDLNLVLPEPGAVEQWATEHISNGGVR